MAYVAVKGGQDAIKESNKLLDYDRVKDEQLLEIDVIKSELKDLLYQVMSESSLYDEDLAALAIKQAMGSMEEAVFLLRAHLSTLPRLYYTSVADPRNMHVERRISSSFKDIPGGQFLGKAYDFKQRFLNFDLTNENKEDLKVLKERFEKQNLKNTDIDFTNLPKVVDYLIKEDLFNKRGNDDREPDDITKKKIEFPSSRSQRLQSLTRGQTGAVTSLGYAKIRGFGIGSHPNIGELRVGDLSLYVNNNSEDEYYIGSIKVTEVEAFCASGNEDPSNPLGFEIGYGLVFGQNETKAIAMSVLDHSLEYKQEGDITGDDEFILLHIDSVESTGFISHLKLPHYVTFQSKLDGIRKIRKGRDYDK